MGTVGAGRVVEVVLVEVDVDVDRDVVEVVVDEGLGLTVWGPAA